LENELEKTKEESINEIKLLLLVRTFIDTVIHQAPPIAFVYFFLPKLGTQHVLHSNKMASIIGELVYQQFLLDHSVLPFFQLSWV